MSALCVLTGPKMTCICTVTVNYHTSDITLRGASDLAIAALDICI